MLGPEKKFWDSTAEWRMTYFEKLKAADPGTLSRSLALEREFVIAEEAFVGRALSVSRNVLEFGCGVGRSLYPLIDEANALYLCGVDYSVRQIALFREVCDSRGWRNVLPLVAEVSAIPLISGRYDAVLILNQTFGTFLGATRRASLREAYRLLREGGVLIIGGFSAVIEAPGCYRDWGVQLAGC